MIISGKFIILVQSLITLKLLWLEHAVGVGDEKVVCVERDRQALFTLKQELIDGFGRLSSWGTEENKKDCCRWKGVGCDNQTGYVIFLDLHGPLGISIYSSAAPLRGEISPSLFELKHLKYLDLSYNEVSGNLLSNISSLSRLEYLNLSCSGLYAGTVPPDLGNLSNLHTLDLSMNSFLRVENLDWLSHLRSLERLRLGDLNVSEATNWALVSRLPLLKELDLSNTMLPDVNPSLMPSTNFSSMSLAVLDLSSNKLNSSVYDWLFKFNRTLSDINLSENNLQGSIPDAFGTMVSLENLDLSQNKLEFGVPESFRSLTTLKSLDLSDNRLTGQLPELMSNLSNSHQNSLEYLNLDRNLINGSLPEDMLSFSLLKDLRLGFNKLSGCIPKVYGQLANLSVLDLTGNQIVGSIPDFTLSSSLREIYFTGNLLNGTLPASIGTLSNLEKLYLGSNRLEGAISEAHLFNLYRLRVLDLSFNAGLAIKLHPDWVPPFQLDVIKLTNCILGPHFPRWLQTQGNVSELDFSGAGISDTIPSWFWSQFSGLKQVNLSYNQLDGMLPDLSEKVGGLFLIDLRSNKLVGPVPKLPRGMAVVDVSKNFLSGSISFLCNGFDNLGYLDLSDNLLSGELPDCWNGSNHIMAYLNLANNNFHGKLPSSIGFLFNIRTFQLRNNSFSGELPESLKNLTYVDFLDLGENKLSGRLPQWIGDSLSRIIVLSLRANGLNGSIPSNLCNLSKIQILDISENMLSGRIPECIKNLTAMTREGSPRKAITHWYWFLSDSLAKSTNISYKTDALLIWKGREFEYKETLGLVKSIDLSSNNLSGEIPRDITSLIGLLGLNLSRNSLTGVITAKIGELRLLNFLDLSRNQLHGEIPTGLSQLSHLGVLDLSYNNFSGRIPLGTQLQSFSTSAYAGNPFLCGSAVAKTCPEEESSQDPKFTDGSNDERHEDKFLSTGFYVSTGLGFVFGFWGVWATLILNRSVRYAFFNLLDSTGHWLYAMTTGKEPRSKRQHHR